MKKGWWWIMLFLIAGIFLWKEYNQPARNTGRDIEADYTLYKNKKGGYILMRPSGWKIEEATPEGVFVARTVFKPANESIKIGNIGEISVTVIATPSAGQALSTQEEFDSWLQQPVQPATDGAIVKLSNETLDGYQAVRLAEMEPVTDVPGLKFWSVTTWVRKEGWNYYINMMGNGKDFKTENTPYLWMLSKFSFLP